MRLLLALLLSALPLAASAQTWTVLDNSPFNGYRFEDAAFVSPMRGWVVNGDGETWETQDGGETWTMRSQISRYLRSMAFPSPDLGWIGSLAPGPNVLFETRDGGATLVDISSRITPAPPDTWGVCGLYALGETHAFGVGEYNGPARFIKTSDGGQTWQATDLSSQVGSLIDVRFTDPMNGLIVGGSDGTNIGGRAVILATTDGGETWTERFRSSGTGTDTEWAWKISFPSETVGYVSVEYGGSTTDGKVLKTTDGGLTWTELTVPGGRTMQGIGFISETEGWTSGRGTTMVTTDGGETWSQSFVFGSGPISARVNRFEFFGDSLGYAMDRRIYKLRRPSTSTEPDPYPSEVLTVSPSPASGPVALAYRLDAPTEVELAVYDALGRRVALLQRGRQPSGENRATWWPPAGASGVYVARLTTPNGESVRRVVIVR